MGSGSAIIIAIDSGESVDDGGGTPEALATAAAAGSRAEKAKRGLVLLGVTEPPSS